MIYQYYLPTFFGNLEVLTTFLWIYFLLLNPPEDHLSLNKVSKSPLESGFVHSKSLFVTYASIKDDKTQGKGWKENNKSYLSPSGGRTT